MCWTEIKGSARREEILEEWEEERKECFEKRGWSIEEIERERERGELREEEIVIKERCLQEEEGWKKIGEPKYNELHRLVKGRGIPGYFLKGWWDSRGQIVANFRLGNEMRGGRYWVE
ncbi:hypothetical protein WN55_08613 [Dufourea novaeangliae]|uniref:Uncharacterized protein n=1 Tax=Dufourea novaeangliae TaxID=178035 RepID=A0A154PT10_DUFNO|nr:hypothetical protein WN55_08613 [Dufourea novaeangliae]